MVTWREFRSARPDLAEAATGLFYQFGVGLAFLATSRADGGPRVHPVCPVIAGDRLFGLIVPSPKLADLGRDGRYALHSFPCPDNEDAAYLTGRATVEADPAARAEVVRQFLAERSQIPIAESDLADQTLVEFAVDTCLITRTTGHGDPHPAHTVWHARPSSSGTDG
jgi:hypothetical protein